MTSSTAGQSSDQPLTPREISKAWLEMHGEDYAKGLASEIVIPDMRALMPDFHEIMAPMIEMSKRMSAMVAVTFPKEQLASMHKVLAQTSGIILRDSVYESYAEMMRGITPSLQRLAQATLTPDIQATINALTSSMAATVDMSQIQGLLASASALREELADQDIDEVTDEFFWNHPELADSIEELPALRVLSKAERNLVIWYVRLCVAMTFTCILLNINLENSQLDAVLSAVGVSGGWPTGKKAGEHMDKALDRLEQKHQSDP